jgi:hypothetical protein
VTIVVARTETCSQYCAGTPSKTRSPRPAIVGVTCSRSAGTVERRVDAVVTKWKVVPEHVAAHDEGAGIHDRGHLGGVLGRVGLVEYPAVQGRLVEIAERLLTGLADSGRIAVHRDGDIADDE